MNSLNNKSQDLNETLESQCSYSISGLLNSLTDDNENATDDPDPEKYGRYVNCLKNNLNND